MNIRIEIDGRDFHCSTSDGVSLAIPMDFDGIQPNHFGAPKANRAVLKLGGFVGDTNKGGSCNVDELHMIPHCNGTHTETVGHIVNEDVFVGHSIAQSLSSAVLLTVTPEPCEPYATNEAEDYRPALDPRNDAIVGRKHLAKAFEQVGSPKTQSLIVRTQTSIQKKSAAYGDDCQPAFFTVQAMQWIVEQGFNHLLVDLPSVDRMYDDGLLTNHHLFWNVVEGEHELNAESRQDKTITEMVLVPDDMDDGMYLLNLQVPSICSDAAPSRPVLFRLVEVKD